MPSLKQNMVHGVAWSAVEKYSGLVVSIVVSIVLARLLSPEEFGVAAIALVITAFLQIFCSLGVGAAIVQRSDLTADNLNSLFTFSLVLAVVLAGLFFAASWPIARFYGNAQLVPVCQLLSVQLLFAAANMVPNALMVKHQRFRSAAMRMLWLNGSSGALAVVAAWQGAGVYSLLIAPIVCSVGTFVWNWCLYPVHLDRRFNLEPVRRVFSFSSYQFLFEFVNYFSRNLDKMIIGKCLSVSLLGFYEKAFRLMQMPMQNITFVITPVMQSVLKDLHNDHEALARNYAKIVRFLAMVSFPLGVTLCGIATEIIRVFYGPQWDAAIPVFAILALSLPLQMIRSTAGSIFMVRDNTKAQFWLGIRTTALTVVGFLVAALVFRTLEAMAIAWTATLALNFIWTYHTLYRRVLRTPIVPKLRELIRPAITAAVVAAALMALNAVDWHGSLLVPLIAKGLAAVVLTLLCVQLLGQYDLVALVRKRM